MRYRKKPVIIDAKQFTGDNWDEIEAFTQSEATKRATGFERDEEGEVTYMLTYMLVIQTLEGEMVASPGDFIIKGIKGEFYPCKPDIFADSYEVYETTIQGTIRPTHLTLPPNPVTPTSRESENWG